MTSVSLRLRGFAALVVLIFFPVFVLALIAGIVLVGWRALTINGSVGVHILVLVIPLVLAISTAARDIIKARKPTQMPGYELSRSEHPALWAELDGLASAMDQPGPDRVVVRPVVNASVTTAYGQREVMIGYPLLAGMTRLQLRSTLAHEMGHLAHGHTRTGRLTYRADWLLEETVARLDKGMVRTLLLGYLRLYQLIAMSVMREHERQADDWSARLVGGPEAVSVFTALARLDFVWDALTDDYLPLAITVQARPPVCQAIYELTEAKQPQIDQFVAESIARKPSRWDTHPAAAERIQRLQTAPAQTAPSSAPESAWQLLGRQVRGPLNPDVGGAALMELEAGLLLDGLTPMSWEQVVHDAVVQGMRSELAMILDQFAAQHPGHSPNLRNLLSLLGTGRNGPAAALVTPLLLGSLTPREREISVERTLVSVPRAAILTALVDQGRAWAALSWQDGANLQYREPSGQVVDWPTDFMSQAPFDSTQVARMLNRLVRDGADIDAPLSADPPAGPGATGRATSASSRRLVAVAEGGVAAVKLRPRRAGLRRRDLHDVLVMDEGLLVTRIGQRLGFLATAQAQYMPAVLRRKSTQRLLSVAESVDGDPRAWAGNPSREALWLPYPTIARATWAKGLANLSGKRLTLQTLDGTSLVLQWTNYSTEIGQVDSVLAGALHGRI